MLKTIVLFLATVALGFFVAKRNPERDVASVPGVAQKLLRDAVRLFDLGFRDPR